MRGTFAIAWADCDIDGCVNPPVDALVIGATWVWQGRAVRVDGPQDVLVLRNPDGAQDIRASAARRASRLGRAPVPNREAGVLDPTGPLRDGFSVTDGRRQYPVAMLRDPVTGRMLLAFPGLMPEPGVEHWITTISGGPRGLARGEPKGVICFVAGTRLRTPEGERTVEDLRPGDRVLTRDDGAQEVLWTGHRRISGARLHVHPELRPIRIRARAIDGDIPEGVLLVSPHHRMLIRHREAQVLFGTEEVLVAARDLIDDDGIGVVDGLRELTYHHLLFARHEVLWANGVPSESFHPAETPAEGIEPGQRAALTRLFPAVATDPASYGAPARRMLSRAEAALLRYGMLRR